MTTHDFPGPRRARLSGADDFPWAHHHALHRGKRGGGDRTCMLGRGRRPGDAGRAGPRAQRRSEGRNALVSSGSTEHGGQHGRHPAVAVRSRRLPLAWPIIF
jgi:hypothetical protein